MNSAEDSVSDLEAELLLHQYFYLPWVESAPTYTLGVPLALHLSQHYKARLTVVCPVKSNAPDAVRRSEIVTERSGRVLDGGVVLVYCPTYKLMSKVYGLDQSVIVLAEWATESHAGWAKLVGAYNLSTQHVMGPSLTDSGREIIERIMFEGYKGWHDAIAATRTLKLLGELASQGGYDREVVLVCARKARPYDHIERLVQILDEFDRSQE